MLEFREQSIFQRVKILRRKKMQFFKQIVCYAKKASKYYNQAIYKSLKTILYIKKLMN